MITHLRENYAPNLAFSELEKKENLFTNRYILKDKARAFLRPYQQWTGNPSSLVYIRQLKNMGGLTLDWKHLNDISKLFFIYGLCELYKFKAITINFSWMFQEKINATTKRVDFIRRRISANFKNSYGYLPLYSFIIEENSRNIHIHGIMWVADNEQKRIEKIIKETCFGHDYKNSNFNKYIFKIKDMPNAMGWLKYILKGKLSKGSIREIYTSRILTQEAQKRYNLMRDKWKREKI